MNVKFKLYCNIHFMGKGGILNSYNRLLLLDSYTCPFFELCEKNAASFLLQHFHVFIIIIVVMLNIFDLPYFPWNCNNNQNITLRERKFKSMIITHEEGEREDTMWFLSEKYFWIYNVNPKKKYAERKMMKQSMGIIDISDIMTLRYAQSNT